MSKNVIFIFVGMIFLFSCRPTSDSWELVWEDDFNQTDGFDQNVWSKIPRGRADWQNYMSDFDSLYSVRDGNLILRGMVNQSLPNDTAPYLTGGLYTKDKMSFTHGRIEIKARLFGAKGAWPAFWLLPQNGKWPDGGEIDIMERLNGEDIAYQTVHSHYTYVLGKEDPAKGSTGKINPDDYNTYVVELYPDSLSFYINDTHTFTYPRVPEAEAEGQYPFNQPFYLLLDMQLGGTWVGEVDPDDLPVEMWIDHVRYYKK